MNTPTFVAACGLVATILGVVWSPAYAGAGNTCWFQATSVSLNFGNLDPSVAANTSMQVGGATQWGNCAPGQRMTLTADNGVNFSGSRRMKRYSPVATNDYIPYSFGPLPTNVSAPGVGAWINYVLSGNVLGSDYANVPAGNYSDTVQLTVLP